MSVDLASVAAHFQIPGSLVWGEPYGTGHINDTYAVTFESHGTRVRYILQRVNRRVFKNIPALMDNIARVTAHMRKKILEVGGDPQRETLTLIPTVEGATWWVDGQGAPWRAYVFIESARTYDVLENDVQAYEAGRAFGRFQALLADLPPPPLHETIPDFHHTVRRFEALERAVAQDRCQRAATCREEIAIAMGYRVRAGRVVDDLASGRLPLRVTHNDTKINNVMLDDQTGKAVCVIDLDTVMPGSVIYDFGDQVRTTVGHFAENEKDLSRVWVDLRRFAALVEGYWETAREFLTEREIELLVFGGFLMTLEVGIRFLTDYLDGDGYFKVHYPGENLDRARTQLALVQDIERQWNPMTDLVLSCRRRGQCQLTGKAG